MLNLIALLVAPQPINQFEEDFQGHLRMARTAFEWSLRQQGLPAPVKAEHSFRAEPYEARGVVYQNYSLFVTYTLPDGRKKYQSCELEKKGPRLLLRKMYMGDVHLFGDDIPWNDVSKWRFPDAQAARGHVYMFYDLLVKDMQQWRWKPYDPFPELRKKDAHDSTYSYGIRWRNFAEMSIFNVVYYPRTGLIGYVTQVVPVPEVEPEGEIIELLEAQRSFLNRVVREHHSPMILTGQINKLAPLQVRDANNVMKHSFRPQFELSYAILQPNGLPQVNPTKVHATIDAISGIVVDFRSIKPFGIYRSDSPPKFPQFEFDPKQGALLFGERQFSMSDFEQSSTSRMHFDSLGWYVQGRYVIPAFSSETSGVIEIGFPEGKRQYRIRNRDFN
jgi:hypothetical protein